MREKIRVTLLANAGILLEGTGARLLIDGLYDPAGTEFQAVPEPVKARLLAGSRRWTCWPLPTCTPITSAGGERRLIWRGTRSGEFCCRRTVDRWPGRCVV